MSFKDRLDRTPDPVNIGSVVLAYDYMRFLGQKKLEEDPRFSEITNALNHPEIPEAFRLLWNKWPFYDGSYEWDDRFRFSSRRLSPAFKKSHISISRPYFPNGIHRQYYMPSFRDDGTLYSGERPSLLFQQAVEGVESGAYSGEKRHDTRGLMPFLDRVYESCLAATLRAGGHIQAIKYAAPRLINKRDRFEVRYMKYQAAIIATHTGGSLRISLDGQECNSVEGALDLLALQIKRGAGEIFRPKTYFI